MKVSEEIAAFAFRIKEAIRKEVGDHECWDRDNFIEWYPKLLSIDTVLRVIDRCMT